MSKSRRSLVRSALSKIRQLWSRRQEGRREMKRCLGSTFEMLEPRLAMTIDAALPGVNDHIHPVLQIYLDGQQVVIPTNVGINGTSNANPHTHDLTGSIHIGEGGPAGTGSTVRNVTLQDFFDVWRSETLTNATSRNANAFFDTDLTDGTNLPRIMDRTVNPSTHILRMYVKENTIDATPQLEYDSSLTTNSLVRPELYVPRDLDQVIISFDRIANVADTPSFQPIPTTSVRTGAPTVIGIDGFDPTGGPLTYTVSVANPSLLTATLQPTSNKSLVMNVADYGQMTFQLFDNLTPRTAKHLEDVVNNNEYNNIKFYRIAHLGAGSPFVIQGGRNGVASSFGRFDDEFNADLQFIGKGLLAMAKSTDDTNDSEIFVTGGDARFLDMNHSIFGVLTDGDEVRNAIQQSRPSGDGPPPSDIIVTSSQIVSSDQQNGALLLKAAFGASGTTTVTLTATDQQGHTFSQTFNVTVGPDFQNPAPFLNPVGPVTGVAGQPITVQLSATDIQNAEVQQITRNANGNVTFSFNGVNSTPINLTTTTPANPIPNQPTVQSIQAALNSIPALNGNISVSGANGGPYFVSFIGPLANTNVATLGVNNTNATVQNVSPLFFDATKPQSETVAYTFDVNHDTGLVTITPPANFQGSFNISVGVRGTAERTTADDFDSQLLTVNVGPGGPTVNLADASDSGSSNSDNVTSASSLDFNLSGLTVGATVRLLKGDTVLAQGVATATTMTLTVSNPATALGQGVSVITATQTVSGQVGPLSTPLNVTFDNVEAAFTSTAPTAAQVGFNLNYNAQTDSETAGTSVVYTLTNAPAGATINASTGVVTWTPTAAQASTTPFSFNIVATDLAGNVATQAASVIVATPQVDIQLSLTRPDGTEITTVAAGQDFVLHVFAEDLRNPSRGVFALYLDILFDSTKATITGPIDYSSTHGSGQSGSTSTAGLIDEVGSIAGTSELGSGPFEVFSIPMRALATATGTLTFSTNPADILPQHNVLVYQGVSGGVPAGQVHFPSASLEIGSTFNAVNDAFNANEDTQSNTINPLANDASIGGASNTLTISALGTPSNGGTVTRTENNTRINYVPAANFRGTETFTYTSRNQNGEEHTATVTMTVADVNDPPVAVADSLSASRNSSGNVLNVLANDTQGVDSGETLRVTAVGTGSNGGTLTIGANGANVLYTPATNFRGTETFTYTISDRATGGLTSQATLTVNVSGLTATNDSGAGFTVNEDSSATTINPLANDALDPDAGGTLSISAVGTGSAGGTITRTENNTRLSYTPAANFQGTETFTYTIADGQGNNATATVSMTVTNVNDPPTAVNDTLTAFRNTTASLDVLANDTSTPDPTENLVIDAIATQPTNGTVTITEAGKKISYTPNSGFIGSDTFTYTIKDPTGATSTATANITVQDFAPSSLAGFVYFDVNNNGVKDAGELPMVGITITLTGTATAGSTTNVNQTLKTGEDGSYRFENVAPGNYQIRQTQPLFVIDGRDTAGSQGGTITNNQIAITNLAQATTGINNNFGEVGRTAATISIRDFFSSTSQNYARAAFDSTGAELWHTTSGTVWQGFTQNTFALQNSQSQIKLDSTNGQSQVVTKTHPTSLPVFLSGTSGNNTLYYVPGGPAGTGGGSTPSNQTPTAVADTFSTPFNTALNVNAANGVLKNDTDPQGTALTASVVTQPANGTLTLNADGSFVFTPTTGFSGTTSFTYRVSDGTNQSTPATATITVLAANALTAVADTGTATEDTQLTVTAANGVLANDTPAGGTGRTATVVTTTTKGTLTLAADGSYTYVPNTNANGTDTFTYRANEGTNQSNVATVTITIVPVNDVPSFSLAGNPAAVNEDSTAVTVSNFATNILAGPSDEASQTLTFAVTVGSTTGTLQFTSPPTISPTGVLTYTPAANTSGTATINVVLSDNGSSTAPNVNATATQTFTITVNAVNDPPAFTLAGNPAAVNEDVGNVEVANFATGISVGGTGEATQTVAFNLTLGTPTGNLAFTMPPAIDSSGKLTYTPAPDTSGTVVVTVVLTDTGSDTPPNESSSAAQTFTITVNPKNDTPVRTSAAAANIDVNEDSANTTAVTLGLSALTYGPGAGSDETSQTLSVKLTAIPSFIAVFRADGTTPVAANETLTIAQFQNLTFETIANANGSGSLTWSVQDSGGTANGGVDTLTESITISVDPINDAPSFTVAGNPPTVNEDASAVTVTNFVTNILAGPTDEASQALTFDVEVGLTTGTLAFTTPPAIGANGALTYTVAPNTSGMATISVTLSDDGNGTAPNVNTSSTQTFTITVSAVNDAPVRTSAAPASIDADEDSANDIAVTLGLSGLTYGPGGGTDENGQALTFKLTSIPSNILVFQANGTTPVNADTDLTLTQLQGLTYKTLAGVSGLGSLTWTVKDDGGTANGGVDTLTQSLSVEIGEINEPPLRAAGNPAAISVNEDASNTAAVTLGLTGLTYSPSADPDESTQTLTYTITAIPAFIEVFKADGTTEVVVNDELTLDELKNLTYKTLANANGTGNLTWSVQDDGGTADGGIDILSETLAVTVNAVNDSPALTSAAPAAIDVDEDSSNSAAVTLGLSSLAYANGGGSDETSQTLTFTITAIPAFIEVFKADGTTEVVANDILTLDELKNLTYKTLPNANGTGNLTWTVKDNGGTASGGVDTLAQTLAISVTGVNEIPELTSAAPTAIDIDEDDHTSTAVSLGFSGLTYDGGAGTAEDNQIITITLTSIPAFISVFRADGATPVLEDTPLTLEQFEGLTYKTIANASGAGNLTWNVKDDGGTADGGVDTLAQSLSITVEALNDAPSFTIAGNPPATAENTVEVTRATYATNISAADVTPAPADEANQTLTFNVTFVITTGDLDFTTDPAIDPTSGNLTYAVALGTAGTATVTVTLIDSGSNTAPNDNSSAAQTFTITVTPASGEGEAEGESLTPTAIDAALLDWLMTHYDGDYSSLEIGSDDWQSAVDQAMAELG